MRKLPLKLTSIALLVLVGAAGGANLQVVSTLPTGSYPFGMSMTVDGRKLYVANYGSNSVSVVDALTMTVVGTMNRAGGPFNVAVSPDSSRVVVAYVTSGEVAVFRTSDNTLVNAFPAGNFPNSIAFSRTGGVMIAYVVVTPDASLIDVVDLNTGALTSQISLPYVSFVNGVVVSPDGTRAYLTAAGPASPDRVYVLDLVNGRLEASIVVEDEPVSVAISPDGKSLVVANYASNSATLIDTATLTVVGRFTTGSNPFLVRIDPLGARADVLCSGGSVSGINLATRSSSGSIAVTGLRGGLPRSGMGYSPKGQYLLYSAGGADAVNLADFKGTGSAAVTVTGMPSELCVSPDGSRVYVTRFQAGGVAALSVPAESGLDLRQTILDVIDWINTHLAGGGLDPVTMQNLQDALDKLQGGNGGASSSGALDKYDLPKMTAALEKVAQAIGELKAATGIDSSAQQRLLAMAARDTVRSIIDAKIVELGAGNSKVVAAESAYANGVSLFNAGDYEAAVNAFKQAVLKF